MSKRSTISVSEENKIRLRSLAEMDEISYNQIIEFLLDCYDNKEQELPNNL